MAGKKPLFSADAAEEYFSTLLTYYRNTGNDIFKRDNEGRHVSDQIYSAEYQKYLGMQIAMREVLEYFAKFELGDTALRQQETVTNRNGLNEPLTLDELSKRNDPVFVSIKDLPNCGYWCLCQNGYIIPPIGYGFMAKDRPNWVFYRQKPEDGHDERKENENV